MPRFTLEFVDAVARVDREAWDALLEARDRPLLSWGFLALLEASASAAPERGWQPNHLLVRREGRLVAAAPLYAKAHSMGEFVFDFEFASVAEGAGIDYYPKLVGMVPFTPCPAYRPLVAPGEDRESLEALILDAAREAGRKAGFGGFHLLWPEEAFAARTLARRQASRNTMGVWRHQTFLWENRGWPGFEAMLGDFSKNMRRNVLRERAGLDDLGVERRIVGAAEAAAKPTWLGLMADYYEATNDKFGPYAAKFLTRDFFELLPRYLPEGWLLSAGFLPGEPDPVGLAFLLEGPTRLYGRYWGAGERIDGLHFELCYYLPMEYALERGLRDFDPGMGSEHKARRGFRSRLVPSLHLGFDPRLARLYAEYLPLIGEAEAEAAAGLDRDLPYKASRPL